MAEQEHKVGASSIVALDNSFAPGGALADPGERPEDDFLSNPPTGDQDAAPEPPRGETASKSETATRSDVPPGDVTPAPDQEPRAPNWDTPDNPYLQRWQQAAEQLEQRQLAWEVQQADTLLAQQGYTPEQRQVIIRAALAQYQADRQVMQFRQQQISLEQVAKPLVVQKLVNDYKARGVDLDPETLMLFDSVDALLRYAQQQEKRQRAAKFDQRVQTGADRVDSVPVAGGESSGPDDLAAALMEADRRRRR